jgi:uncharacterized protein (DUF58 family)
VTAQRRTFPLVSKRRRDGVAYGTQRSLRRGQGAEVAGSRPYRAGDRLAWIDWSASARLSRARDDEIFVVREYYAELAPRVIVVVDRRPSMSLYSPVLPYLSKPAVVREAATAIAAAAHAARAYVGYLDISAAAGGETEGAPHWIAPHRQSVGRMFNRLDEEFDAPPGSLEEALVYLLGLRRDVPNGSFVFVLSDFLEPPAPPTWSRIAARGWDVIPVVVQDPTWERSFPPVERMLVPVRDPVSGKSSAIRLTARETSERRAANETRFEGILRDFQRLRFDPVVLEDSDPANVDLAFLTWATRRRLVRGRSQ